MNKGVGKCPDPFEKSSGIKPDKYTSIPTFKQFKKSHRTDLSKEQIDYVTNQISKATLKDKYLSINLPSATPEHLLTLADVLT